MIWSCRLRLVLPTCLQLNWSHLSLVIICIALTLDFCARRQRVFQGNFLLRLAVGQGGSRVSSSCFLPFFHHPTCRTSNKGKDNTDSFPSSSVEMQVSLSLLFILVTLKKNGDTEVWKVVTVDEAGTGSSVCFQGSLPALTTSHLLLA